MNSKATTLKRHPLSALFSRLDLAGEDLAALVEDIKAQGLLSPITTHEGMVLDGWNRYTACTLAGVEPVTIELHAGADPWEFVKGSNMLRRHMSPAERVAVMLLKMQMGGVPNGTAPSVREIQKDLEVGQGTAQRAQQVAQANDPAITAALADKRVSLDRAAEIAKMPEPERKAALEAPPEPKPKVITDTKVLSEGFDPKADSENVAKLKARIAELEAENADLQERCSEAANLMQTLQEENEAMQRTLDAEDLKSAFQKEVKRAHERARIAEARCTGLTVEVNELKGFCKMWKGKFERLEKANKKSQEEADELAS